MYITEIYSVNFKTREIKMAQVVKKKFRASPAPDECKGCGRCVSACPKQLLKLGTKLNFMGVPYAEYAGSGCLGCGACFYTCPEPGAITIYEITEE